MARLPIRECFLVANGGDLKIPFANGDPHSRIGTPFANGAHWLLAGILGHGITSMQYAILPPLRNALVGGFITIKLTKEEREPFP